MMIRREPGAAQASMIAKDSERNSTCPTAGRRKAKKKHPASDEPAPQMSTSKNGSLVMMHSIVLYEFVNSSRLHHVQR